MKAKIWKYDFPITDTFFLELPNDSLILKVECQQDIACMWVLFGTKNQDDIIRKRFILVGTGHEFDYNIELEHIATFQQYNGQLVWHLFLDHTYGG